MTKSIIKEVFIITLLIVIILLVLGIILYDYIPTSKKIPNIVETYALPTEMSEELNETLEASEKQNIVKVYRVEAKDLKQYESSKNYEKGKANPFEVVSTKAEGDTNTNEGKNTGNSSIENNSNPDSNNTSGGKILNIVGK